MSEENIKSYLISFDEEYYEGFDYKTEEEAKKQAHDRYLIKKIDDLIEDEEQYSVGLHTVWVAPQMRFTREDLICCISAESINENMSENNYTFEDDLFDSDDEKDIVELLFKKHNLENHNYMGDQKDFDIEITKVDVELIKFLKEKNPERYKEELCNKLGIDEDGFPYTHENQYMVNLSQIELKDLESEIEMYKMLGFKSGDIAKQEHCYTSWVTIYLTEDKDGKYWDKYLKDNKLI